MVRHSELATLGGGCFWCVEAVYEQVKGIEKVVSGYAGGLRPDPTYEQVCSGATGHAEVVQLEYDPELITYRDILEIFFATHDPTTLNRQGADVGTQYRSVIFFHDKGQKATAEDVVREVEETGAWPNRVITEISPFTSFYPAEDYHQQYYRNHPEQGYCRAVIAPKLSKFRSKYLEKLKPEAVG